MRSMPRDDVDLVILELIRLVSSDTWTESRAAAALRAKHYTRPVLRAAQSRVLRVRAQSVSRIADRAAATLSATLGMSHAPALYPGSRRSTAARKTRLRGRG